MDVDYNSKIDKRILLVRTFYRCFHISVPSTFFLLFFYVRVYRGQTREYFGLRDFYSLVKMLFSTVKRTQAEPTDDQIIAAVQRNFGGYFGDFDPTDEFLSEISLSAKENQKIGKIPQVNQYFSVLLIFYFFTSFFVFINLFLVAQDLVRSALSPLNDDHYSGLDSRYILLLTKNNAALKIIQEQNLIPASQLHVMFGSNFRKDQEYIQICSNIRKIKIAMELGHTVILYNLNNLYESLYDALNQNYLMLGKQKKK